MFALRALARGAAQSRTMQRSMSSTAGRTRRVAAVVGVGVVGVGGGLYMTQPKPKLDKENAEEVRAKCLRIFCAPASMQCFRSS